MGGRFLHTLRLVGRREFWSFRVVHAVLGGLLTVGGACSAILVDKAVKTHIKSADDAIATALERIGSIDRALSQFRIVQTNGVLLGALAQGEALRPEYRSAYVALMFVLRRGPTLTMLGELYGHDFGKFSQERALFEQHIAAAAAPDAVKQSWDDVLDFEMTRERRLMDLQETFRNELFTQRGRKRAYEATLATATTASFVVQQIGFVIVLMAGLLYQHRPPRGEPAGGGAGAGEAAARAPPADKEAAAAA